MTSSRRASISTFEEVFICSLYLDFIVVVLWLIVLLEFVVCTLISFSVGCSLYLDLSVVCTLISFSVGCGCCSVLICSTLLLCLSLLLCLIVSLQLACFTGNYCCCYCFTGVVSLKLLLLEFSYYCCYVCSIPILTINKKR